MVLLVSMLALPVSAEERCSVLFINVGKGDAALISAEGTNVLIDAGPKAQSEQVLKALAYSGAERLDAVILTHTDKDHSGGLKKLLKAGVQADALYRGAFRERTADGHPAEEAGEKYSIPVELLAAGDVLSLTDRITLTVLGPLAEDPGDEDNNSLVLRLETPWGSALFTGDMKLEAERLLISTGAVGSADVLKVAHHGQKDATGQSFVSLVKPSVAVISTDISEDHDSADAKVISRLWDAGAKVLITQDAEIGWMVTFSPEGITFEEAR